MDHERPVLCMEHCKNVKMFGFTLPMTCSNCGTDLQTAHLRIPPFRIPTPFRNASTTPCAIVLKPTTGDFLTDYKNSDNLHIGLTLSTGVVYEYDRNGLEWNRTETWTRCLAISDLNNLDKTKDDSLIASWAHYWDFTLHVISGQNIWTKERYHEKSHNCYTFVLNFLRALQIRNLDAFARDRGSFCREFILPKTTTAAKYITLYRKIAKDVSKAISYE